MNDKEGKPVGSHQFIGRRPIAAFGYSEVDWKLCYEDQSPVSTGSITVVPVPEVRRNYPVDPPPVASDDGLYIKFQSTDYPGRRYSFFYDAYLTGVIQ